MSSGVGRSVTGLQFTMAGLFYTAPEVISVATSATLIPVGQVTAPHWAWFRNMDATNFLKIRNGASGADVIQLFPGECTPAGVPLFTTGTYYAIADTAACLMEYMVFSL